MNQEVLKQTREARETLTLIDELILALQGGDQGQTEDLLKRVAARSPGISALPDAIEHVARQVETALEVVRKGKAVFAPKTMEQLRDTDAKLVEVAHATESAASQMMDGLESTLALVDSLEDPQNSPDPDRISTVKSEIASQIFDLFTALQFQDITAQQISHIRSILNDLEDRLSSVSVLVNGPGAQGNDGQDSDSEKNTTFDPQATMGQADSRQAIADEIFRPRKSK